MSENIKKYRIHKVPVIEKRQFAKPKYSHALSKPEQKLVDRVIAICRDDTK